MRHKTLNSIEDNKKKCEEISVDKENTDYENSINELLNDIPD